MQRAGVTELKARLSEYLAAVRGGDEVIVTDRGRPVARLIPAVSPPGTAEEGARLRQLERAGAVRIGTGEVPPGFWEIERPSDPNASVRHALLEERRSSR